MIWFKYVIIAMLFFIFSWLQASFLPYFSVLGAIPNLIFILFFIIVFFEQSSGRAVPITTAIIAGIISDLFLPSPFGVSIAAFLVIYFLYRIISHFLRSGQSDHLVFYFIGMFSVLFVAYHALLYLAGMLFPVEASLGATTFISLVYSLAFGLAGFYVGKALFAKSFDNQLKLL